MIEVHVYADADEVEVFQNGMSIGRAPCGRTEEYRKVFTVPYRPGEISVIARCGGAEIGRDTLRTASATAALSLSLDQQPAFGGGEDLAFITIRTVDQNGNHVFFESSDITVKVVDGGSLLALGNADPKPDRSSLYSGERCALFEGGCSGDYTQRGRQEWLHGCVRACKWNKGANPRCLYYNKYVLKWYLGPTPQPHSS